MISCPMYETEGICKIGYTIKPGLLKNEVEKSLIQRYGTTLVKPYVYKLVNVSQPREAETAIFEKISHYHYSKEIFKIELEKLDSELDWLQDKFKINGICDIPMNTYDKCINKLKSKITKISRNPTIDNDLLYWINCNNKDLHFINSNNLNRISSLRRPIVTSSKTHWTKIQQNANILSSRKDELNIIFSTGWNFQDYNLLSFLKNFIEFIK